MCLNVAGDDDEEGCDVGWKVAREDDSCHTQDGGDLVVWVLNHWFQTYSKSSKTQKIEVKSGRIRHLPQSARRYEVH